MRFVFLLTLLLAVPSFTAAKPGDRIDISAKVQKHAPPVRMVVNRSSAQKPSTLPEFRLEEIMTGLGKISDLASDGQARIFALDPEKGRLWQIQDRNRDGNPERRRVIASGFNNPTAVAFLGGHIFVADTDAVWKLNAAGERSVLAPLKYAQIDGGRPGLLAIPEKNRLILGFTKSSGGSRLVSIDPVTGTAEKLIEISSPLTALSVHESGALWAATQNQIGTIGQTIGHERFWTGLGAQGQISSLLLQDKNRSPENWPHWLDNHILAAQSGPGTYRLLAIPTQFGQVSDSPVILVDGFLSPSGRSAWGKPGAMLMDERGLFFADEWRGSIWRLSVKPPDTVKIVKEPVKAPLKPLQAVEKSGPQSALGSRLNQGSQIGENATTIRAASTIDTGSTIIKQHEENRAKAEKKKAQDKEDNKKPELKPAYNLD